MYILLLGDLYLNLKILKRNNVEKPLIKVKILKKIFLFLSRVPLHGYTTFCLSMHQIVGICVCSIFISLG